ncbi:hypothetical protein ALC57_10345 [Trachymyrmex cornetzi]|uniref:Uncharacterized protein n=1 Tax=Trachymyrmex cornetzi TaxID=471704 RepID=A0A195DXM7_9HYME|nr:hypothetical protein ALC57_10345 [Trachymyrmex cornetzi]
MQPRWILDVDDGVAAPFRAREKRRLWGSKAKPEIEYRRADREDVAANKENKAERLIAINVCRSEQR